MKPNAILFVTVFLVTTGLGQPQVSPRVTPLGTQRPKPNPANRPDKKNEPAHKEQAVETLERAVNAHGGRQALISVRDSVSEGKLTFFSGKMRRTPSM